jgi:hypothetical protein
MLTNNDFANFPHCDKDFIPIAYGLWWTSRKDVSGPTNVPSYSFDPDIDHGNVKGGAFLWGEYGIAIDFEWYKSVFLLLIFADNWLQDERAGGDILERKIRLPLHHVQRESFQCHTVGHFNPTHKVRRKCHRKILGELSNESSRNSIRFSQTTCGETKGMHSLLQNFF